MNKPVVMLTEDVQQMLGEGRRALLCAFMVDEARALDKALTAAKGKPTQEHLKVFYKYLLVEKPPPPPPEPKPQPKPEADKDGKLHPAKTHIKGPKLANPKK